LSSEDLAGLIAALRARGARVLLDSSGEGLASVRITPPDILKVNSEELAQLTGRVCEGQENVSATAGTLLAGRCKTVVVTMGAGGAVLVADKVNLYACPPDVEIRNTVGAGDAFTAGLLSGIDESLREALLRGVATGTAQATSSRIGRLERAQIDRIAKGVTVVAPG
jgi:fructose-1-phosphate kinase PfkB-like protein